jgi:hypothetical protein
VKDWYIVTELPARSLTVKFPDDLDPIPERLDKTAEYERTIRDCASGRGEAVGWT